MTRIPQVASDIYQITLPLPFALNHVHCYLLKGDKGWTILDTGLNIPGAFEIWQAAFSELGIGSNKIEQIILTHTHPDHYGMAGELQAWCSSGGLVPPVRMSPREAQQAELIWLQGASYAEALLRFFESCGVPLDLSANLSREYASLVERTLPHPTRIEFLEPGEKLSIGQRRIDVLQAGGHSDGHLLFYDRKDRLILCGDHILRKITPVISIWPDTDPDPLGRYLNSIRELAKLDVRLALPGHGPFISNWQERLAELYWHHMERLEHTFHGVTNGESVFEVATQVFPISELSTHEIRFAVAETLAHLDYLRLMGKLSGGDEEIMKYRKTGHIS